MSIRRKLAATGATVALVFGGVLAASPAQAAPGGFYQIFGSKQACEVKTKQKVAEIKSLQPEWVKVRYVCKHVDGLYGTSISWSSR